MKRWLTVAESAEYSGLSRDTIYTACERRELRHARVAGRRTIRVRPEWIDAWLEQHARGAKNSSGVDAHAPTTVADASRYSGARSECIGTPGAVDSAASASRRLMNGPQHGYGDGR